jgi:ABC-2 type transport system ATP-binding protein
VAEDVEAMCDRVVVLDRGEVSFAGAPMELAALAAGRVWLAERVDHTARMSWRTADGRHRHVGEPPAGAELIAPTVHDGYLLLGGASSREAVA